MKKTELRRLVKDYLNPCSEFRKMDIQVKDILMSLFGDLSYEIEFFR
jgi:hypothetical protein